MKGILIVEDEDIIIESIKNELINEDVLIYSANNSVDVKKVMDENSDTIQLILLDLNLKDESGESIMRDLHPRILEETKVVAFSGLPMLSILEHLVGTGISEVIQKPIDENFKAKILSYLK